MSSKGEIILKTPGWSELKMKDIETAFLFSTILCIGSMMEIRLGSADAEIIKNSMSNK